MDPTLRHTRSKLCVMTGSRLVDNHRRGVVVSKYLKVSMTCSCGISKEYYEAELKDHIFICNGLVILKYDKNSSLSFGLLKD